MSLIDDIQFTIDKLSDELIKNGDIICALFVAQGSIESREPPTVGMYLHTMKVLEEYIENKLYMRPVVVRAARCLQIRVELSIPLQLESLERVTAELQRLTA